MPNSRSRRLTATALGTVILFAAGFAGWTALTRYRIDALLADLKSGDAPRATAAEDALSRYRRAAAIRIIIAAYDDVGQDSTKITDVLVRIGPPAAAPLVDELARDPRPWYKRWWKRVTGQGAPPETTHIEKISRIIDALAKIGPPAVAPLLANPPEEDSAMFGLAARAFEEMGDVAVPGLLAGLKARQARTRAMAAFSLGLIDDPRAIGPLIAAAQDPKERDNVRYYAAWALGKKSDPKAFDAIVTLLAGKNVEARRGAAGGLYYQKDPRTTDCLLRLVIDSDPSVRENAIRSLHAHPDPRATTALVSMVLAGQPMMRSSAIEALAHLNDPAAVDQLIDAANAGPEAAAHNACIALEVLRNKSGLAVVNRFLEGVNIDYVGRNYKTYIERGDSSTEWLLIIALERVGDPKMARDFWLCERQGLQQAGASLAIRKMLSNVVTLDNSIPHPVWGSNHAAALPLESTAPGTTPRPAGPARTIDDILPATR